MISKLTKTFEPSAMITELTVSITIDKDYWAGTDDSIYISMGHTANMQLLKHAPSVGSNTTIEIDILRLFGKPDVHISEIEHVAIFQIPTDHPLVNDDWELGGVTLTVNGIFSNSSFRRVHQWLGNHSTHLHQVWGGQIKWSAWSNNDQRPIDLNAQTYPVRWLPYIADLKSWRTYDPSKIDGVGQLIGMIDGKLVGELLKTRETEILHPNAESDSYTWVYTPEGSIIYRRWKHADTQDYIRHSQLGSGRPVICAGEFKVESKTNTAPIKNVIVHINDASGHYKPDGGSCLRYVAEKLRALGIDVSETQWCWTARS